MSRIDLRDVIELIQSYDPPTNPHVYNLNFIAALQGKVQKLKNTETKKSHRFHNKRWRREDNSLLMQLYGEGHSISAISTQLGRATRSTQFQLSKMLICESRTLTWEGMAAKYKRTPDEIHRDIDTLHV